MADDRDLRAFPCSNDGGAKADHARGAKDRYRRVFQAALELKPAYGVDLLRRSDLTDSSQHVRRRLFDER